MAKNSVNDVLARYGAWYHGDDDLFAHCIILRGGQCALLFQGLQTVTVKLFRAPTAKHKRLVALLKQPIPSGWPNASYTGYNFITEAEGPNASEIAAWGVQPGARHSVPECSRP